MNVSEFRKILRLQESEANAILPQPSAFAKATADMMADRGKTASRRSGVAWRNVVVEDIAEERLPLPASNYLI